MGVKVGGEKLIGVKPGVVKWIRVKAEGVIMFYSNRKTALHIISDEAEGQLDCLLSVHEIESFNCLTITQIVRENGICKIFVE